MTKTKFLVTSLWHPVYPTGSTESFGYEEIPEDLDYTAKILATNAAQAHRGIWADRTRFEKLCAAKDEALQYCDYLYEKRNPAPRKISRRR